MNQKTIDRMWSRMDKSGGPDACWPWTGCLDKDGYGRFAHCPTGSLPQITARAHRVVFEHVNGYIDPTLVVMHTCDHPGCCNPKHLKQGTNQDNIIDCSEKRRTARGDRNGANTCRHRMTRGENHWSKKNPELLKRGDQHWTAIRKKKLLSGETTRGLIMDVIEVREIRDLLRCDRMTVSEISKAYGTSWSCIRNIQTGETWKNVV